MTFDEKCQSLLGMTGDELIKKVNDNNLGSLDLGIVEYLLRLAEKEKNYGDNVSYSKRS